MIFLNLIDKTLSLNGSALIAKDGDDRILGLSLVEPNAIAITINDDLSGEVEYLKVSGQDNTPNLYKTFNQSDADEVSSLHQTMLDEFEADKQGEIAGRVQELIDLNAEEGPKSDLEKATDNINKTKEFLDEIGADYSRIAEIHPAESIIAGGGSWYDVATQLKGFIGSETEWEDDNNGLVNRVDYYRQAIIEMDAALSITDKYITRSGEYARLLPFEISGTGQVNAFKFNLANPMQLVKSWRESVILATIERLKAIKLGSDRVAWREALDLNPLADQDSIESFIESVNDQGDFRNTSDSGPYNGAPVVNSVYQYRLEMIGIVTQQLAKFWDDERANSTMYREAERIKVGNTNSSYMHEQIIGNPQYELWYKNVVAQFSDKMQAIFDAATYEEADTAFATAINYDGPYPTDERPMPITWTQKETGWQRRTDEATDPYNALQSARAKLVALGLTENEALALCYYEGDDSRMLGEWE